jgi:hypothetical protein
MSTRHIDTRPSSGLRWARRVGTHVVALAAGLALGSAGDGDPPYRPVVPPTVTTTVTTTVTMTPEFLVPPAEEITPAPGPDPVDDTTTTSARASRGAVRTGTYYANCAAARQAGAAPLSRGESGYRAGLDRDHDGTACE